VTTEAEPVDSQKRETNRIAKRYLFPAWAFYAARSTGKFWRGTGVYPGILFIKWGLRFFCQILKRVTHSDNPTNRQVIEEEAPGPVEVKELSEGEPERLIDRQ